MHLGQKRTVAIAALAALVALLFPPWGIEMPAFWRGPVESPGRRISLGYGLLFHVPERTEWHSDPTDAQNSGNDQSQTRGRADGRALIAAADLPNDGPVALPWNSISAQLDVERLAVELLAIAVAATGVFAVLSGRRPPVGKDITSDVSESVAK